MLAKRIHKDIALNRVDIVTMFEIFMAAVDLYWLTVV